jgi:predicted nucleotidyltransferase
MKFGLSEDVLDAIRGVLVRYPAVEEAVVFGSRSAGGEKPGCGVDLALHGKLSRLEARSIALELDDLPLPFSVDVLALAAIHHPGLRAHVSRTGQSVYRKAAPPGAGKGSQARPYTN